MSELSSATKFSNLILGIKLKDDGSNWVLYRTRIYNAITAQRGLRRLLEGTAKAPVKPEKAQEEVEASALQAYEDELEKYEDAYDLWMERQATIKSAILASIPERYQTRLVPLATAKEMWDELSRNFEKQSDLVKSDLFSTLVNLRTPEGGSVTETIDKLLRCYNDYCAAGGLLEMNQLASILINAIPKEYHSTINAMTTTASLTKQELTFEMVTNSLTEAVKLNERANKRDEEESKAMAARYKDWKSKSGSQDNKSKSDNKRKSESSNKRTKKGTKSKVQCYNCQGYGHISKDCPSEREDKDKDDSKTSRKASKAKTETEETEASTVARESKSFSARIVALKANKTSVIRYLDTGASEHYENDIANFIDIKSCDPITIQTSGGKIVVAKQKGTIEFATIQNSDEVHTYKLTNVYYTPGIAEPLISIGRLRRKGLVFSNNEDGYATLIEKDSGKVMMRIKETDHLYPIRTWKPNKSANSSIRKETLTVMEAHEILAHISPASIIKAVKDGTFTGINIDINSQVTECEVCLRAKAKRKDIAKVHIDPRTTEPGHVHADCWGPTSPLAKGGYDSFVLLTEIATRFRHTALMKGKKLAFDHYKGFEAWLENQHNIRTRKFHSDRGGEFLGEESDRHLERKGTERSATAHDTPEHNGIAERGNQTIVERARAMLLDSKLPRYLWGYAVLYSTWLTNRLPTSSLNGKTPYEALYKSKPDLSRAHKFGCRVFVKREAKPNKLGEHGHEGTWIGPSSETDDGHRIYWKKSGTVTVERNVVFTMKSSSSEGEKETLSDIRTSSTSPESEIVPIFEEINDTSNKESTEQNKEVQNVPVIAPRRENSPLTDLDELDPLNQIDSDDEPITGHRDQDLANKWGAGDEGGRGKRNRGSLANIISRKEEEYDGIPTHRAYTAQALGIPPMPKGWKEAIAQPKWKASMDREYNKINENKTYELVPPRPSIKPIPLMWVYDYKLNAEGTEVVSEKSRVVVRGDKQQKGVDYNETTSWVMKPTSRNILLAMAAVNGWHIHTGDFENAYLNATIWRDNKDEDPDISVGKTDEMNQEIYVKQIPGYEIPGKEDWIGRLRKGWYGLKQSGRIWYYDITGSLQKEHGFKKSLADPAVFYRRQGNHFLFVALHVDDPLIIASHLEDIFALSQALSDRYAYNHHGELSKFLGAIYRRDWEKGTISINQRIYIDAAVEYFGLADAKPVPTPLPPGVKLGKEYCPTEQEDIDEMKNVPYRELLGMLSYIANHSRPDISFATNLLSQVQLNPGRIHWEAAKRILRYLKGTRNLSLTWGKSKEGLTGYTDSGFASEDLNWKSMGGYVFTIAGGAISWAAKKQSLVALSTSEAEYIAMCEAVKELLWIRKLLTELFRPLNHAIRLYADNQSAISMAKNHQFSPRTKHIAIRYHFIHQHVENHDVAIKWTDTNSNIADIFTKVLDIRKTRHFASGLGLFSA